MKRRGVVGSNKLQQLMPILKCFFTDRFHPRKVRMNLQVNFKLLSSLYLVWDVWSAYKLVLDYLLFERNKNPPLSTFSNAQLKMSLVHSAVWWFVWWAGWSFSWCYCYIWCKWITKQNAFFVDNTTGPICPLNSEILDVYWHQNNIYMRSVWSCQE